MENKTWDLLRTMNLEIDYARKLEPYTFQNRDVSLTTPNMALVGLRDRLGPET
jgi:hypothetical protein